MGKHCLRSAMAFGLLFAQSSWGQCNSWTILAEIDDRAVSDPPAFIRAVNLSRNLDENQDQAVSLEEIDHALVRAELNLDSRLESAAIASRRFQGARGEQNTTSANDVRRLHTASDRSCDAIAEAGELRVVRVFVSRTSTGSFSLVGPTFHEQFGSLNRDARAALAEADVKGNNDGLLTLDEYQRANRRSFMRRGEFQRRFGDDVHHYVLSALSE